MRLNRGTIVLLLVSVLIIGVVLVLSSNQASAPDAPPTIAPLVITAAMAGPVFPDVAADTVIALQVVDNASGDRLALQRDTNGNWNITETARPTDRAVDQTAIAERLGELAAFETSDLFETDDLAQFGLAQPAYVVTFTTDEGTVHTLYVGGLNPAGNRRYVLAQSAAGDAPEPLPATPIPAEDAEATDEPAPEADEAEATEEPAPTLSPTPAPTHVPVALTEAGTVQLVIQSQIQRIIDLVASPPYVPPPTSTPPPTATLNPLSEVQQATATAEAAAQGTQAINDLLATITAAAPEATAEATPEAGG